LKLTASFWKESKTHSAIPKDNVSIIHENLFPFLDMDLIWDMSVLAFRVYKKVNSQLKYFNSDSSYTPTSMKAILHGVCFHLVSLTTQADGFGNKSLSDLYPEHAAVLEAAGLV
jgi:hypothetical protein